ncbi:pilus assembly PilX N-terminal domain-containing protein [Patescibacteria group bacterium]|nr:pilus assembly PilX N-terminal domain-containing protein [Patescibacteria group bacterium]MCG2694596.1 pilus assembly PilX N-terminal domain-containing protein [Candidatus Parcubacteria bacterium]
MNKINKIKKNKGFVILIATLLGSLFLIIGAFIFNISLKEIKLSSGGRESQYAFYAADSGIECAMYWDSKNTFATSTGSGPAPANISCLEQNVVTNPGWVWNKIDVTSAETIFQVDIFPSDPNRDDCAIVKIMKNAPAGTINTIIESRGYNTCDVTNLRRVERGLRAMY